MAVSQPANTHEHGNVSDRDYDTSEQDDQLLTSSMAPPLTRSLHSSLPDGGLDTWVIIGSEGNSIGSKISTSQCERSDRNFHVVNGSGNRTWQAICHARSEDLLNTVPDQFESKPDPTHRRAGEVTIEVAEDIAESFNGQHSCQVTPKTRSSKDPHVLQPYTGHAGADKIYANQFREKLIDDIKVSRAHDLVPQSNALIAMF